MCRRFPIRSGRRWDWMRLSEAARQADRRPNGLAVRPRHAAGHPRCAGGDDRQVDAGLFFAEAEGDPLRIRERHGSRVVGWRA